MNFKKFIVVLAIALITFSVTACNKDLSMEEQAWKEATTYIEWFSDKNDADLKPGVYSEERVVKNSDLNYTCCVAVTTSDGNYDQWYITVEKKLMEIGML
ncbi:MAG: hypothetical protein PHC56_05765 [Herbinix sp.]|nr:hypothetical protein [Herbinix sp.]